MLLLSQDCGLLWAGPCFPSDWHIVGLWRVFMGPKCTQDLRDITGDPAQGFLWLEAELICNVWLLKPPPALPDLFLDRSLTWVFDLRTLLPSGFRWGLANGKHQWEIGGKKEREVVIFVPSSLRGYGWLLTASAVTASAVTVPAMPSAPYHPAGTGPASASQGHCLLGTSLFLAGHSAAHSTHVSFLTSLQSTLCAL